MAQRIEVLVAKPDDTHTGCKERTNPHKLSSNHHKKACHTDAPHGRATRAHAEQTNK